MPTTNPTQIEAAQNKIVSRQIVRKSQFQPARAFLLLPAATIALISACALLPAQASAAQTAAPASAATPKPIHHHKRPGPAHPEEQPTPDPPALVITPPPPETPKWPAFDPAAEASVVWDSHGLRINAANSSLQQILKDVSMATGAKVDGMAADQRVFGVYGPGQARDVLSQLLQGSGYNVIMIGDQGQGAPRQILLTQRQAAGPQNIARNTPTNANEDDNEPEDQPVVNQEPPARPNFPPGAPPRTPQQIMQEMQQRQQQQQPQPQQNPANPNY
jgi:hypothetical protein